MQVNDDIFLGGFSPSQGTLPRKTTDADPTLNNGIGPAGRIFFFNIVPLTAQTTNVATAQHMTQNTGLTLAAGTGSTSGTAPDGSGSTVIAADVERCVQLTSTANLSAINFTLTAYDFNGVKFTSKIAGPNNNSVTFPKAALQVLSIVPDTTDGTHTVSAGFADIFGLPFVIAHVEYIQSIKWAGAIAPDAGVFTPADTTSPATNATGDVRGTYQPSSASNGTKRLVISFHLDGTQVGPVSTITNVIGVAQV